MRFALHPCGSRCPPRGHPRSITACGGPHHAVRIMALEAALDPYRVIHGSHSMTIRIPFIGAVVHTIGVRTSRPREIGIPLATDLQLSLEGPVAPICVIGRSCERSVLLLPTLSSPRWWEPHLSGDGDLHRIPGRARFLSMVEGIPQE